MKSGAASQPSVLLIDDDDTFRTLVRTLLRRAGTFEVVAEAADGAEGVDLAAQCEPDLVILDLLMPGMDGFEALPRLRATLPEARILVLTALEEQEASTEGVLFGMDSFLEKRHVSERLVTTLEKLHGRGQQG